MKAVFILSACFIFIGCIYFFSISGSSKQVDSSINSDSSDTNPESNASTSELTPKLDENINTDKDDTPVPELSDATESNVKVESGTPKSRTNSGNRTETKYVCEPSLRNTFKTSIISSFKVQQGYHAREIGAYQKNLTAHYPGYTQAGLENMRVSQSNWLITYIDTKIAEANSTLQASWTCQAITRAELGL